MAAGNRWPQDDTDRHAWFGVAALLDWLPLATVIMAGDGTAVQANQAWAALSAAPPAAARGDGWLRLLAPADRVAFAALLRAAAEAGQAGWADVRLAGADPERRSRWWWRPGPDGQLVVCVAELDDRGPGQAAADRDPDAGTPDGVLDVLGLVVHRLFGIGLEIQSAAGMAGGPAAHRLQLVVDELDDLIREARDAAFRRLETHAGQYP